MLKIPKLLPRFLLNLFLCAVLITAAATAGINLYMYFSGRGRILTQEEWKGFDADSVLVLGCAVRENGEASPMLKDRMSTASEFYNEASVPLMIVSGDHRSDDYNEVKVMEELAVFEGVPESAIYLDHTGVNTYASIVHCREILGEGAKIVIVTQSYHLYRALYLAERLGLDAYGAAADVRAYMFLIKGEVREILARVKDFFYGLYMPELSGESEENITDTSGKQLDGTNSLIRKKVNTVLNDRKEMLLCRHGMEGQLWIT